MCALKLYNTIVTEMLFLDKTTSYWSCGEPMAAQCYFRALALIHLTKDRRFACMIALLQVQFHLVFIITLIIIWTF